MNLAVASSIDTVEFGGGHSSAPLRKLLRREFRKFWEIHIWKTDGGKLEEHIHHLEHLESVELLRLVPTKNQANRAGELSKHQGINIEENNYTNCLSSTILNTLCF